MIDSEHEEKAHQEDQAAQSGEGSCALRRGTQKGLGGGEEKEDLIVIGSSELLYLIALTAFEQFTCSRAPQSPLFEARLLATKTLYRARLLGPAK